LDEPEDDPTRQAKTTTDHIAKSIPLLATPHLTFLTIPMTVALYRIMAIEFNEMLPKSLVSLQLSMQLPLDSDGPIWNYWFTSVTGTLSTDLPWNLLDIQLTILLYTQLALVHLLMVQKSSTHHLLLLIIHHCHRINLIIKSFSPFKTPFFEIFQNFYQFVLSFHAVRTESRGDSFWTCRCSQLFDVAQHEKDSKKDARGSMFLLVWCITSRVALGDWTGETSFEREFRENSSNYTVQCRNLVSQWFSHS
jgi:hypothetical protein